MAADWRKQIEMENEKKAEKARQEEERKKAREAKNKPKRKYDNRPGWKQYLNGMRKVDTKPVTSTIILHPDAEGAMFRFLDAYYINKSYEKADGTKGVYPFRLYGDETQVFTEAQLETAEKDLESLSNEKDILDFELVHRYREIVARIQKIGDQSRIVNFGYSMKPTPYSGRLEFKRLTTFFGVLTERNKEQVMDGDKPNRKVQFFQTRYANVKSTLIQAVETADDDLEENWMDDSFMKDEIGGYVTFEMERFGQMDKKSKIEFNVIGDSAKNDRKSFATGIKREEFILPPSLETMKYMTNYNDEDTDYINNEMLTGIEEEVKKMEDIIEKEKPAFYAALKAEKEGKALAAKAKAEARAASDQPDASSEEDDDLPF